MFLNSGVFLYPWSYLLPNSPILPCSLAQFSSLILEPASLHILMYGLALSPDFWLVLDPTSRLVLQF